jgi:hypothetical protein
MLQQQLSALYAQACKNGAAGLLDATEARPLMHPIGDDTGIKNTGGPVKSHRGTPGHARDRARAASAMV